MRRVVTLPIDHIGWCARDYKKMLDLFDDLGFHMGDFDKTGYVIGEVLNERGVIKGGHYYMGQESSYIETIPQLADGTVRPYSSAAGTIPFDSKGVPGVYNLVINAADTDRARAAAIQAGFPMGEAVRAIRRTSYYETIGGSQARCSCHFLKDTQPFPNMFLAMMSHLTRDLTPHPRSGMHEYHPNGYEVISAIYLCYESPQALLEAQRLIHRLADAVTPYAERHCRTDRLVLLDPEGYEREFGVPYQPIPTKVVAVEFRDGDRSYVESAAAEHQLSCHSRDGKFYVDGRQEAGVFLIFAEQ